MNNREIKFRAWDEEDKKIISWKDIKVYEDNSPYLSDYFDFENTPLVLMQYTGLKDKNGKEIYEGDIVKGYWQTVGEDAEFIGEISWGYSRWEADGYDFQDVEREYEIIGNIYETPNLLK